MRSVGGLVRSEHRRRRIYALLRIRHNDPMPCPYCGRTMIKRAGTGDTRPEVRTRDHVVAKSRGGKIRILCCQGCNTAKGNKTPEEWLLYVKEHWPEREEIVRSIYEIVARDMVEIEEQQWKIDSAFWA